MEQSGTFKNVKLFLRMPKESVPAFGRIAGKNLKEGEKFQQNRRTATISVCTLGKKDANMGALSREKAM